MNLPVVKQSPSPNYTAALIAHDKVFIHDMEGYYLPSVAYLCRPEAQASAHLCMNDDGSEFTQLVPLQFKAWAQRAFNGQGVSIEMPGFVGRISDATLGGGAWAAAWLCRAYDIPPVHAEGGQGRGVCSHHDLGPAGGGHVDIGPVNGDTWQKFMTMLQAKYAELGAAPLPAWALHGAPAPHTVTLPPPVTPMFSHDGVPRNEPGDAATQPTASGYPLASRADVQWRLRKVGANPQLGITNIDNGATHAALGTFQRACGLPVTQELNPATWAALEKMTS